MFEIYTQRRQDDQLDLLHDDDWTCLTELIDFLTPFDEATEQLSGNSYPTSSLVVPFYNMLMDQAESFKSHLSPEWRRAANLAYDKLDQYYAKTTDMYTIATLCDPKFNMAYYLEDKGKGAEEAGPLKQMFRRVYNAYKNDSTPPAEPPAKKQKRSIYADDSDKDEVDQYLQRPREPAALNTLDWWKLHEKEFPIIAQMARDHLAIQATSVESERLFSMSEGIMTKKRSNTKPCTLQQYVCVKFWSKTQKC